MQLIRTKHVLTFGVKPFLFFRVGGVVWGAGDLYPVLGRIKHSFQALDISHLQRNRVDSNV